MSGEANAHKILILNEGIGCAGLLEEGFDRSIAKLDGTTSL